MSLATKEELKNLKKLISNIEELIKLNIAFQKKLENNSKPNDLKHQKKLKPKKNSKKGKKPSNKSKK